MYAATNAISNNSTAYKVSLAVDIVLVATLVSFVCMTVIGKVDLGLGEVGTLNNSSVQAMISISALVFAFDVMILIKSSCQQNKFEKIEERAPPVINGVYVREMLSEHDHFPRDPALPSNTVAVYNTKHKCYMFINQLGETSYKLGQGALQPLPEEGVILPNGQRLHRDDISKEVINLGIAIHTYKPLKAENVAEMVRLVEQSTLEIKYAPRLGIVLLKTEFAYYYRTAEMDKFLSIPKEGVQVGQYVKILPNGQVTGSHEPLINFQ